MHENQPIIVRTECTTTWQQPIAKLGTCHCISLPFASPNSQYYLHAGCGLACAIVSLQDGSFLMDWSMDNGMSHRAVLRPFPIRLFLTKTIKWSTCHMGPSWPPIWMLSIAAAWPLPPHRSIIIYRLAVCWLVPRLAWNTAYLWMHNDQFWHMP
jgi:hypothetical protein